MIQIRWWALLVAVILGGLIAEAVWRLFGG